MNPLKKWVLVNKYFVRVNDTKDKKANASHFLLDGGIWKIPKSEYPEFLKLLATDLCAGEKHYITENKTNVFRFICDLDFFGDTEVTGILEIVDIIQSVIKEYYTHPGVIICGSDTKIVNDRVKSGFHLVWPKIWIDTLTAKKLRLLFIERLVSAFGVRPDYNSWEDVVDLSVYDDNGLRMVGCRKMGICKSCKNKKEIRETCESCHSVGRKDENRVYSAKYTLDYPDDYLPTIQRDFYVLLLETSIYNYNDFPATELIKELPDLPVSVSTAKKGASKKPVVDETTMKIENFIRKNYKEFYAKVKLKKVTVTNDVFYAVSEDNFCMNVNRNHTSSGVYFEIKASGVCQRCYCKKESLEGRLHGPCNTFSSPEIALTPQLKTFLFGPTVKVSKKEKKINTFNLSRNSSTTTLDLSQGVSKHMFSAKEICLENCKSILHQLEKELI
jgi:hypothetical protein